MPKHDKDYDATVARMVGNMLAGDPDSWQGADFGRDQAIKDAIETALEVRKRLRKLHVQA